MQRNSSITCIFKVCYYPYLKKLRISSLANILTTEYRKTTKIDMVFCLIIRYHHARNEWFWFNRAWYTDNFLQKVWRVYIPDHLCKSSPDSCIWYYIGICAHNIRIIAMKKREHWIHEITCTMSRPVYKERLGAKSLSVLVF